MILFLFLTSLFFPSLRFSCFFSFIDIVPSPAATSLETSPQLVSFPFQLGSSSRSSESTACSHLPAQAQQQDQLSQGFNSLPSTDVIDVPKLARQDQPPPAYENVDECPSNVSRPSPLAARASRPLPMPPLNLLTSSSSVHLTGAPTDSAPAEPYETATPAPQSSSSAPNYINSGISSSRPFSSLADASHPTAVSFGLLHPLDSFPSQDWLDRRSAVISTLPSQSPSDTLPSRMTSEFSQQPMSSGSYDHNSSWIPNESSSSMQQTPVSSQPVSSESIQPLSPPPPYFPSEVSSSRNVIRPLSESAPDMRPMRRPQPVLSSSTRGLPPPAPPTILDPPPARSESTLSSRAPHEPFLSDAPPPPDSWIAVETSPVEYRIVARLPGFRRDAMCAICFVTSACSLTG